MMTHDFHIHLAPSALRLGLLVSLVGATLMSCTVPKKPLCEEVDPFIGTGGHGHTYPGATVPFGMVQLSPDTRLEGWDGCGGFHITDDEVYGFSHTHLQGTGVSDYGDVLLMPTVGPMDTGSVWRERYRDRFVQGVKKPMRLLSLRLGAQRGRSRIDSQRRVGHHRWTLSSRDTLQLVVDLAHRDDLINYGMYPLDDSTLVGAGLGQLGAGAVCISRCGLTNRLNGWIRWRNCRLSAMRMEC